MHQEAITRIRNAFAQAALAFLDEPASPAVAVRFSPPFSSMTEADWREAVRLWRVHAADLLETVPKRLCPACGSTRSRWLFESYDAHSYEECHECGCWFVPRRVDSSLFEQLFARSAEARALAERMTSGRDRIEGREADMKRVGSYLDTLLPLLPRRTAQRIGYLDTGCGVGHSLRAGLARGLSVQGVEVDPTAIALARAEGLPVVAPTEPIPEGPYHLLSFWETLEHIAAPLETLDRFVSYLADDGLVAITVPNLNALATRTMREACAWIHGGYNTPGHINMFHHPALERLLQRAGLTMLDVDGLFSGNPVELAASWSGATRGAFDALDPSSATGALSESLRGVLEAVWPGTALIERLALASPILQVVACRRGREAIFAAGIAGRREARRRQIEGQARALIAGEPDYKAIAVELQREIDRRDDLLRKTQEASQKEIGLRDELLSQTQQSANDLQHRLAEAQAQINLRDDLLVAVQKKLDDTLDERIRVVLRALRGRRSE